MYLRLLQEYATRFECAIHAYVLMTNHVHLLATPHNQGGVGKLMQAVGRKYVNFVNYSLQRTGTLWEGRYKSCLVGDDPYVLACYRYIEFNPVRARMARTPAEYRWSSHGANGYGRIDTLLSPHRALLSLAESPESRSTAYLAWLATREGNPDADAIRLLTNRNRAFAEDSFREALEREYSRPMGPLKAGRRRKASVLAPELRL